MARGRRGGAHSRSLTVIFVIFFLVAAGADQAPLQHEVTVTLKLIQVFVTGPDGKPARDLARSDFVLTDNGKPQTITDFESHVLAIPASERAVAVDLPAAALRSGRARRRFSAASSSSSSITSGTSSKGSGRPRPPPSTSWRRRSVRTTRSGCSRCPP